MSKPDVTENWQAPATSAPASGSEAEMEINYPCVVDAKLLSALTMCGDAIIRDPRPDRIKHWARLRARIHKQAKPLNDQALPRLDNAGGAQQKESNEQRH